MIVGIDTCHGDFKQIGDKEILAKIMRSSVCASLHGGFTVIEFMRLNMHTCGCYNFGIYILSHHDRNYYEVKKSIDQIMFGFSYTKYNLESVRTCEKLPFVKSRFRYL